MKHYLYDEVVRIANPFYDEMLLIGVEEIAHFLSRFSPRHPSVLEIGIGTGNQINVALEQGCIFSLIGVDPDSEMLKGLWSKLQGRPHIKAHVSRQKFQEFRFDEIEEPPCIAIVNLVLHYFPGDERTWALRRLYTALERPGILIYGDRVLAQGSYFGQRFSELVSSAVKRVQVYKRTLPRAEDFEFFKYDARENPISISDLLAEVTSAGFEEAEIVWKRLNYVVAAAVKL